jgi:TolB-like protein
MRSKRRKMPRLMLHLSGPFRATLDGRPLTGLSRRAQGMLAYLACQVGMRAERGTLTDVLWSDRSESQARASLRQELSVLRKTLPETVLGADRQAVWLTMAEVHREVGTGEALQGFDLPSEGFEDWLRQLRIDGLPVMSAGTVVAAAGRAFQPALAVLPFDELGIVGDDMFADGVVEEITGALGRVREFDVIARQSSFALRGEALPVPAIAERLGADYVVEGSVQRSGGRVRIAVHLVRGRDGHTLWSERFDDQLDDLFDLQDRIAARVAGQLSPNLRSAEITRAGLRPLDDRTVYELMLTAYPHFWSLRREGNERAAELLDQAMERDPDYVPAMALRAWVYAQQTTYMWSDDPAADRTRGLALAERAVLRAEDHAPSLVAIAGAFAQGGDDRALAQTCISRALSIDPNNAWAWIRQGWLHQYVGEVEPALAAFERAQRLSPLDPFLHQITFGRAATLYRWRDDPREGLALIEEGLRRHPGVVWPLRMLAVAYVRLGEMEKAREAIRRLRAEHPNISIAYLQAALPPIAVHFDAEYYAHLAAAGLPTT